MKNKLPLFSSAYIRYSTNAGGTARVDPSETVHTNIDSTASFRYQPAGYPLKSTQQLNVDYSKFENHTFFNSAVAKTNVAFYKIINQYPFDGTLKEFEDFIDKLTGYEKYVLDTFPKNKGYITFIQDDDNYIEVRSSLGATNKATSRDRTARDKFNPGLSSFGFETFINPSSDAAVNTQNQTIFMLSSSCSSFTSMHMKGTSSTSIANCVFTINSGSTTTDIEFDIPKGEFSHVGVVCDRSRGLTDISVYKNGTFLTSSLNLPSFNNLYNGTTKLYIGKKGDSFVGDFSLPESFSGSFDEFRYYRKKRTSKQIRQSYLRSVHAEEDLSVYFRFNEPTSSFGNSSLVLDHSGNSLHATIQNYTSACRSTVFDNPVRFEETETFPILFPTDARVKSLNSRLISSASSYDEINPNLITRLVPPHYLFEAEAKTGISSDFSGSIANIDKVPGTAKRPMNQAFVSLLLIWASQFDEIKQIIDSFGDFLNIDYTDSDNIPDTFLPQLSTYLGFDVSRFFSNATFEQFFKGYNITSGLSKSELSLKQVQNEIWRRILIELPEIRKAKGTIDSIKMLIRSAGLDPDIYFRFREFGGNEVLLNNSLRVKRKQVTRMLDFSGSLANSTYDSNKKFEGFFTQAPFMSSSFLIGDRVEEGFPLIDGTFVSAPSSVIEKTGKRLYSNDASDGLFTSGSFTYEAQYKFENHMKHFPSQSIARLQSTGSNASPAIFFNLVANSGSVESDRRVNLYVKDRTTSMEHLYLKNLDIFDGSLWNISFGRIRNDDPTLLSNKDKLFLRCSKAGQETIQVFATSSAFNKESNTILENINSSYNAEGMNLVWGLQDTDSFGSVAYLLSERNNDTNTRPHGFSGKIRGIKFYSKALSEDEFIEHTRNPFSLGVKDPSKNFNFDYIQTGSFEKLRLDMSCDQYQSGSITTPYRIFDYSQNEIHGIFNADENTNPIKQETIFYETLSPKFDESQTDDKVRVRSFKDSSNIHEEYQVQGNMNSIPRDKEVSGDARFSIEFSVVNDLNEDIMRTMSSFDYFNDSLGETSYLMSEKSDDIEFLSRIYFKRLDGIINQESFMDFFKWFDSSFTPMITKLIPSKTNFLGVGFYIEPHVLERSKFVYRNDTQYLNSDEIADESDPIIISEFNGKITS